MKETAPAQGPLALIRLGYACNNNCVFCHSSGGHRGDMDVDTERARGKILLAAARGAGAVVFTGGEATIRKDFLELMKYTRGMGLGTGLISNGRMFCYEDFARQAADIGLDYILISLHGPDARTHDMLTGAASFEQTLTGLAAVSKSTPRVVVNTVLTRWNLARLARTARLLEKFAPVHYKISLPEPKGAILDRFDIVLPPREAAKAVADFLVEYKPGGGVTVGIDGLTPCLLDDYFFLNDDFHTHGFYLVSDPGEDDFYQPTRGDRSFSRNCIFCSMRHLCPGIYTNYFEKFPGIYLRPMKREVSNSVRFDFREKAPASKTDSCVCETIRGCDPSRTVAVRNGSDFDLFATRETQTDVPELMDLKFDIEQVYVAASGIEKQGSHPAHLKKLQLEKKCRECRKLRLCPGAYTMPKKQPFTALKARMGALIGMLEGRVCEIGCGTEPNAAAIKKMIQSGRISFYLGIDPALALETKTGMAGRYILKKGLFEELKWDGLEFDFVIMLRSYNHLADLKRAGSVLSAITATGSKLIITEDYKIIELKNNGAEAGGQPGRGFEHIRNHTARDAVEALGLFGFEGRALWEPDRFNAGCWAVIAERKM